MRLFIDMDNVLTDYSDAACSWFNHKLFRTRQNYISTYGLDWNELKPKDLKEYEVYKNYGLPDYVGIELNQQMWDEDNFWRDMDPMYGALNVVKRLQKQYDVWIATRPVWNYNCVFEKWEWVKVRLPELAGKMVFSEDKSILFGDILIDDKYEHLIEFTGRRIIYDQPYNQNPPMGYRVHNWQEIEELLNGTL